MAQDATPIRSKEVLMRRQMYGMTLREAKSTVWDDWSGCGFHVDFPDTAAVPLQNEYRLGTGSFATVYKTICKEVALAWKSEHGPRSGELREIESLKKLSHTHIVK